MDLEFYIYNKGNVAYSYSEGSSFFTRDDRVLVTGFLSALHSFATATMKEDLNNVTMSSTSIYFKKLEEKPDILLILIVADYESELNVGDFFKGMLKSINANSDFISNIEERSLHSKITRIVRSNIQFLPKSLMEVGA
ncbi:MAG: hypothetical protein HeimC3_37930 [Candidatus Heimdallarchaeota archaeon LC_3]|nr:MAG: hypothetical protein HeimC3_50460 [Candidatus Heimdallarchaeota archaeon LC_3]OLS21044.1 MAG: hypothetical protein HeimC3_37930 [Candidatus Heimdallarchaeota archaeon LC_3]